jgi:putative ABC transport system ATP-binding protein
MESLATKRQETQTEGDLVVKPRLLTQYRKGEAKMMIQLSDLHKSYQMGDVRVEALDRVDLKVDQGEFVVILGPSGSGKTTLLNMIGALDVPSSGDVLINGTNLSRLKRGQQFKFRRESIGFVFQTFNLFPSLTAQENVQYVLDVVGRKNGSGSVAVEALNSVGLGERMCHFPHQLSGGEQQRVAIARALAYQPRLILADEPTGNLDAELAAELMSLLCDINYQGATVLVATHDHALLESIPARTLVLQRGVIAYDGIWPP